MGAEQNPEMTKIEIMKQTTIWIRCPNCRGKTRTKVYPDTVLLHFPLYCPKCKRTYDVDVVNLRMRYTEIERTPAFH